MANQYYSKSGVVKKASYTTTIHLRKKEVVSGSRLPLVFYTAKPPTNSNGILTIVELSDTEVKINVKRILYYTVTRKLTEQPVPKKEAEPPS